MFSFSTLTKRPSYRLSSAKSWKWPREAQRSGTRSSLCGCSRRRGFWPPKHPLMHKSWGWGGRFGGKYSRNGITEMPKGEEQACDCSLRTDNDLPWVPYFHMTRALQMACGHKVSISSAVIDAERETSLCFQLYDATIRAARALHSVLFPSQEPGPGPLCPLAPESHGTWATSMSTSPLSPPRESRRPRTVFSQAVQTSREVPPSSSSLTAPHSYKFKLLPPSVSRNKCNFPAVLQAREILSFLFLQTHLPPLPPSCIYGTPNFKNNVQHLLFVHFVPI